MQPVLVVYATREGQTRRIAEHLGAAIRARGSAAEVINATELPRDFSLDRYGAAVVAASVHVGKHAPEIAKFVREHRARLEAMPAVFLSVSLSEAGAEDAAAPADRRAESAYDVERMIEAFLAETAWHPKRIRAVAGALLYTQYNFLTRFVMKMIARRAGGSTDTSHDHEYTDWAALDRLVDELLAARD